MSIRRPLTESTPLAGLEGKVRMVVWPMKLRPYCYEIGTVEGTFGDDVLVRFGEVVMQVPAEWLEPVGETRG